MRNREKLSTQRFKFFVNLQRALFSDHAVADSFYFTSVD